MLKVLSNEKDFDSTIKEGKWLVDFYAEWCGPCKMLSPIIEELSKKYNVLKVDTDKCPSIAMKFGIMSIPTLIVFENGTKIKQSMGYMPLEEVEDLIK
ncbi:MAG TPA: thioredoxin [Candidatus Coprovivens excrementavium]|nr:thioredoxin [Candidatus Coprovivens excrementavium]